MILGTEEVEAMLPGAVALTILLLAQPSGTQSNVREVGRTYWELLQTTEIWLRLIPENLDGKPPLVSLTFQAFFPGRPSRDMYTGQPEWPKGPPARLTVRAEPFPLTVIRELALRLVIDDRSLDLTGPKSRYRNLPCLVASEDCTPNAVEADIEPALLDSLVSARTVQADVLGFRVRLVPADLQALGEFQAKIGLRGPSAPSGK